MVTIYEKLDNKLEVSYSYTTFDLLQDKPCFVEKCGYIYPIKVEDYIEFTKLSKYLGLSKINLELPDDIPLLQAIISICSYGKNGGFEENGAKKILKDICDLFTLVARCEVEAKIYNDDVCFESANGEFVVNSKNYDLVRVVIMKQNLINEPLHFKDKLAEKWYYKARMAERKSRGNKIADIDDIILTVSEAMKFTLNYIMGLNIFQLNSYYSRIIQSIHYETISKYRCVGDVKSNLEYTDPIIPCLFKQESMDDVLMSKEGLTGMLT